MTKAKAKTREGEFVRVPCTIEGYEDNWIEFEVSAWTVFEFRAIPEAQLDDTLESWVEKDTTAWKILDLEGKPILHPGRGAEEEKWMAVYKRMPLDIARWLSITPYSALQLATVPDKKRTSSRSDNSN